jgi:hypothetical protein
MVYLDSSQLYLDEVRIIRNLRLCNQRETWGIDPMLELTYLTVNCEVQ